MKRSLIVVSGILIFVLITSGGGIISRNSSKALALAPCYHAQVSTDNALLEIVKQDGIGVSGNLIQQHFQKDSAFGTFKGKFLNNQLTATFSFYSEGQLTDREVVFNKSGKALDSEGYRYVEAEDCRAIKYPQGLGLIPVSVQLPLYLFPKLRISPYERSEADAISPAPISEYVISYKTSKGVYDGLVSYFLWNTEDWDSIYNPNEAPSYGYEIWRDENTVLTVGGPQDCIYENKIDCQSVNEISQSIMLGDSYSKVN
jgi:hypothetical protein